MSMKHLGRYVAGVSVLAAATYLLTPTRQIISIVKEQSRYDIPDHFSSSSAIGKKPFLRFLGTDTVRGQEYEFLFNDVIVKMYKVESSDAGMEISQKAADWAELSHNTTVSFSDTGVVYGGIFIARTCKKNCMVVMAGPKLEQLLTTVPK